MNHTQQLPLQQPTSNAVLERIIRVYPGLSGAERQVADFVLGNPNTLARTPMSAITSMSRVSAPTIMRFCRAAGFTGLTDFKLALVAALAENGTPPAADRTMQGSSRTNELLGAASDIVAHLRQGLSEDDITAAQILLSTADAVMCMSTHDLLAASIYAREALLRHGVHALTPDAPGYRGEPCAATPANAIGLFFCNGPPTAMLADTITCYHRYGKGAIVIGDMCITPHVQLSVHIHATSSAGAPHYGSTRLLPHLLVTDLLIKALVQRLSDCCPTK